jgi:LCP family protein required for cell wall assembly
LSLLSFVRRFAIACLVVALLAVVGVYAGDAFARKKFEETRKVHVPNLVKARPGKPANYLLIGSDTRAFVESGSDAQKFGTPADAPGQRSDVVMVLHVDPASRTGRLVSFPRDLVVNIPGYSGHRLLNAAYQLGGANGPALLINTLESNFPPLKINHYIEVDFKGFQSIVNAIGRVKIYFPTPVNDQFTGLHIAKTGCVSLDGAGALAYARSRHYNIPKDMANPAPWQPSGDNERSPGWIEDPRADLDRIPRQQYFLRTISQAAIDKTASNPTKLFGLLDAVKNNFTRDTTLKFDELKALIRTFNGLDPRKVQMETLPNTTAPYPGFSQQVIASQEANAVIASLMFFGDPSPPLPALLPPNKVRVRVVDGSGVAGAAQQVVQKLTAAGFQVTGAAEEADRRYDYTQVRYAPGKYAEGYTTIVGIGTLQIVEAISAENTLGADVLLVVGRDYGKLKRDFTPTKAPAASATTGPGAPGATSTSRSTSTTSTTVTTLPQVTPNTKFVPVDPKTGDPLVGCPD